MSRRIKTLIMALGVIVLLGGGYYGTILWKKNKSAAAASSYTPPEKLGDLDSSALVKLEPENLTLEKKDELWELVSLNGKEPPAGIELDQDRIRSALYGMSGPWIDRVVDDEPEDLSVYGLDKPLFRTAVTDSGGRKVEYIVGDMTPSRTSYYVMAEGDPKVYIVSSYAAEGLNLTLDQIRYRTLYQDYNFQTLTHFRMEMGESAPYKKLEIVVKPENAEPRLSTIFSGHLVISPYLLPRGLDSEAMDKLLAPFANLEKDEFIDDTPSSLAPYGLDKPIRLFLENNDKSIELLIGNPVDGKRYAKLPGEPGVFTVSGMEDLLTAKPFSLIDKFALLVNIDSVENLSVSGGERPLNADFQGTGDDAVYLLNGKQAESKSFKTWYQAVIGLLSDAEYPGPAAQAAGTGNITIEYRLTRPPGARASITLVPYNRDFYALNQEGTTEFLISRNQVQKIYETADAMVFE